MDRAKDYKIISEWAAELEETITEQGETIGRLREAWADYVVFMKDKYGEPFAFTCEHLIRIDKILSEESKG